MPLSLIGLFFFFFNDPATTEIYTLSLHDALPISSAGGPRRVGPGVRGTGPGGHPRPRALAGDRSEEHTSELQSLRHLVCRLLLEKKKKTKNRPSDTQPIERVIKLET